MAKGSKMGSKAAGAAKGAAKALAGYPGIFHHLAGEHAEVATLMKRVANTSEASEREELFGEIRKNLLAHAHGEEQEFYPELRKFPEIEPLVTECLREHKKIEEYLDQLNGADKSSDAWQSRFDEMMTAVETHVEREEDELFPKAKDLLDGQVARDMEERYEKVEEQEKSRL
jgi:hemerythrin superfamily protein